jgi:hypothetical protein
MQVASSIQIEDLVARIRAAVRNGTVGPDIELLRNAYDDHAKEINRRLRTAAQWLREGLTGEALHFVECHPDSLAAAAAIEMGPDLQHFMELCTQAGIELPARIDEDIAAEISNAYAHHREIEPLVRKHRLASLMGGPASLRIKILRQLVEQDAASSLWKLELRTAVGLRIREIAAAASEAEERLDIAAIDRLRSELSRGPLREHPSASACARNLSQCRQTTQQRLDEKDLKVLAGALHVAVGEHDVAEMRTSVEGLQAILARGLATIDGNLVVDVKTAESWLAGHDRAHQEEQDHRQACEEIESLLDNDAPWREIERIWNGVVASDRPIAEQMERRVRVRQQEAAATRRMTTSVIVASVVLLVASVAAAIGWTITSLNRKATVAEYITQISAAIERNDVEAATAVVDRLLTESHGVRSASKLGPVLEWVDESTRAANEADRRFGTELSTLYDLEGSSESHVKRADRVLGMARTISQKELATRERSRITSQWERLQAAADADVAPQRDVVAAEARRVKETAGNDDQALIDGMDPLLRRLEALLQTPALSSEARTALQTVRESLGKDVLGARERISRQQQRTADLKAIEEFSGSLTELLSLLERYVAMFPETPQAARFSDILRDRDLMLRAAAVLDQLKIISDSEVPRTLEEATSYYQALEAMPRGFLPQLNDAQYQELLDFTKASERLLADPTILRIEQLRDTFTRPWANRMVWIADASGAKHYSVGGELESMGPGGQSGTEMYRLTEVVQSSKDLLPSANRTYTFVTIRAGSNPGELLKPASMVGMADGIMRSVVEVEERQGQPLGMHLRIAGVLQKASDVPAPLRAELLRQVLEYHGEVGWPSHSSIGMAASRLAESSIGKKPLSECDWGLGSDEGRRADREFRGILESVTDFVALERESYSRVSIGRRALRTIAVVGVAWPSPNDGTIGVSRPGISGDLFVVTADAGGMPTLKRVGTVVGGQPNWDAGPPPLGTPLLMSR